MDADTDILSRHHGLGENDIASEVNETLDSTMTSVGPDVSQESVVFTSSGVREPLFSTCTSLSYSCEGAKATKKSRQGKK